MNFFCLAVVAVEFCTGESWKSDFGAPSLRSFLESMDVWVPLVAMRLREADFEFEWRSTLRLVVALQAVVRAEDLAAVIVNVLGRVDATCSLYPCQPD